MRRGKPFVIWTRIRAGHCHRGFGRRRPARVSQIVVPDHAIGFAEDPAAGDNRPGWCDDPVVTVASSGSASTGRWSRPLRWTIRLLTVVVAFSFVAGLIAAALGDPFTDFGSGAGGLFGFPALLTTFIALFLALPAAVIAARSARDSPRWRGALVIGCGAWLVAIGYFQVAHTIDPCANGWWGFSSRIGDQQLCEYFGSELNWHTRFHLLAHAGPGLVLLATYLWAIRRWASPTAEEFVSERSTVPDEPSPSALS